MRKSIVISMVGMAVAMGTASCKKDFFNKEQATEITKATYHNDTVDARHTWNLIADGRITVKANVPGVKRIDLLTTNPYISDKAELLATANVEEDDDAVLIYSAPSILDTVYADAVATTGTSTTHTVKAIATSAMTADFSTVNTPNNGRWTEPAQQEVYYCFCNSFPKPSSSWDFNDCVLRISKEIVDDYTLRLNVTLEAVGSMSKTAAAIRLENVAYDQVESITTVGKRSFVKNQDLERTYITSKELLIRGNDGSAVLNLFDDAHAAFYSRVDQTGSVYRYYFNVMHSTTSPFAVFAPTTVSYDIKFRQDDIARNLTYTTMDPFIICAYNAVKVEVHKFRYKLTEVLNTYLGDPQNYKNSYTWALEIPYSWFRYPMEGNPMGSYKGRAIYGSYSTPYHSFGEWGANRNVAQDWYLFPENNMVY